MTIVCDMCDGILSCVDDVYRCELVPLKDLCSDCYSRLSSITEDYGLDLETIGSTIDILESAGFAFGADYIVFEECDDEAMGWDE